MVQPDSGAMPIATSIAAESRTSVARQSLGAATLKASREGATHQEVRPAVVRQQVAAAQDASLRSCESPQTSPLQEGLGRRSAALALTFKPDDPQDEERDRARPRDARELSPKRGEVVDGPEPVTAL
jgi:hypothetical protein